MKLIFILVIVYDCTVVRHTKQNKFETRMHSSRMRTGRSLTVCCGSSRRGGVCLVQGGSPWFRGVCLVQGGFSLVPGWGSAWSWGDLPGPGGFFLVPGGWSAWSRGGSPWSWGGSLETPPC